MKEPSLKINVGSPLKSLKHTFMALRGINLWLETRLEPRRPSPSRLDKYNSSLNYDGCQELILRTVAKLYGRLLTNSSSY